MVVWRKMLNCIDRMQRTLRNAMDVIKLRLLGVAVSQGQTPRIICTPEQKNGVRNFIRVLRFNF